MACLKSFQLQAENSLTKVGVNEAGWAKWVQQKVNYSTSSQKILSECTEDHQSVEECPTCISTAPKLNAIHQCVVGINLSRQLGQDSENRQCIVNECGEGSSLISN